MVGQKVWEVALDKGKVALRTLEEARGAPVTEDGEGNWRWSGVPWEALGGFQIKEWRDLCRTVLFGPYKKLSSLFTGHSGGTPMQDNADDCVPESNTLLP